MANRLGGETSRASSPLYQSISQAWRQAEGWKLPQPLLESLRLLSLD